jgi:hypothetical protein
MKQSRRELLDALGLWLKETAWKWNKGMEQAHEMREALVSIGETYEEMLGAELELFTDECDDGTGFLVTYFVDPPTADVERDTVGPVRLDYVPGLTDEQKKQYAERVRRERDREAELKSGATDG